MIGLALILSTQPFEVSFYPNTKVKVQKSHGRDIRKGEGEIHSIENFP